MKIESFLILKRQKQNLIHTVLSDPLELTYIDYLMILRQSYFIFCRSLWHCLSFTCHQTTWMASVMPAMNYEKKKSLYNGRFSLIRKILIIPLLEMKNHTKRMLLFRTSWNTKFLFSNLGSEWIHYHPEVFGELKALLKEYVRLKRDCDGRKISHTWRATRQFPEDFELEMALLSLSPFPSCRGVPFLKEHTSLSMMVTLGSEWTRISERNISLSEKTSHS